MIARAPGKLVLSGAYAVLEGAPALVAAVDRYVTADASREAELVTPEVAAALALRGAQAPAPWFDVSALRTGGPQDRKIGLGSSAAILVASLGALELADKPGLDDRALCDRVFRTAVDAHRKAQGGGSGIDVAASAMGGFLRCVTQGGALQAEPTTWPAGLVAEAWASPASASTSNMLAQVFSLRDKDPGRYRSLLEELSRAARAASAARDAPSFLEAARAQLAGLSRLGAESGAPIVTPANHLLDERARSLTAVVLPSGAGGGDVVIWLGTQPSDPDFAAFAEQVGFSKLDLSFGARGVHAAVISPHPARQ